MKKSFTLIEILVVATIIGLLAAAAAVSYSSLSKGSRDAKRKTDFEQIRAALEMYRSNDTNGYYPVTGSCSALGTALTGYIGSMPKDPKNPDPYYLCSILTTDYTLGAYLEGTTSSCGSTISCGTNNCNYCLGPYGKK